jgi:Exoribonuclease R
MLSANVAAAEFLIEHEMPVLFRIHEIPKEEKLKDLRAFLGELGLSLGG